jgi:hypothetical protein
MGRYLYRSVCAERKKLCAAPPACSCPCSCPAPYLCICPLRAVSISPLGAQEATYSRGRDSRTPARVQCMSMPPSVSRAHCLYISARRGADACGSTYVDFAILEAFLEIVVDGLVGDLADQREIRDTDFLLLGRLEDGLLCEVGTRLSPAGCLGSSAVLLAPGALCYCLCGEHVSASKHQRMPRGLVPWLVPKSNSKLSACCVGRCECRVCCWVPRSDQR